jgi:hypothetical protein
LRAPLDLGDFCISLSKFDISRLPHHCKMAFFKLMRFV